MIDTERLDAMFSGVIGQEYDMLKLVCPAAAHMSQLVGIQVGKFKHQSTEELQVLELGCGTGITTLAILSNRDNIKITAIDNEAVMQDQARQSLNQWIQDQQLDFILEDALSALQALAHNSVDIIASAYTIHNFLADYREKVLIECYRVLKPGGQFINGDRYGLDNISEHTRLVQQEVSNYFEVFSKIDRLDLLEHWVVHIFSDESENHVMREGVALAQLEGNGFKNIQINNRDTVNALVVATK